MHQFMLFRLSDYRTYGLIGATFSLVYLSVIITDLGLEPSISPFFSTVTKNKHAFKKFILMHLIPNIVAVFTLTGIAFALKAYVTGNDSALVQQMSSPLLVLLGALVLSENIKKSLRTLLHLAFLNRTVAFIEVSTIVSYVACVWTLYMFGATISLPLIFAPMLAISALSNFVMAFFLYRFQKTLADEKTVALEPIKKRVIKSRLFNYLNQLSHQFFSSNFLVPFFAFQFGLANAGIFKLVSHTAHCITGALRKIFGLSSDAILAHTKTMTLETKRAVFLRVTQRLHHALYGIIIFFAINHGKMLQQGIGGGTLPGGPLVYLFLIICLSENFFIIYEKFYITQERTERLFAFNLLTMLLTYMVIQQTTTFSQLGALLALITVRVSMFALLSLTSFYTWRIKPQWRLQPRYLAAALCVSLSFFMLF